MGPFPLQPELEEPLDDFGALPEEALEPSALDDEQPPEDVAQSVDYNIKWSKERRDKQAARWCSEIDRWYEFVATRRIDNLQEWRRAFELMPVAAPERWPGSATTPADFTRNSCEAHHTRLNAQIIQADPPFAVMAREPAAVDVVPQIEEAMASRLEEAEWHFSADEVHAELPIAGNCFYHVYYEQEVKRVPDIDVDWDENAYKALLVAGMPPAQAMLEAQRRDAQGRLKRELAHKDVLVFAGTRFKAIPFEDGFLFPPTVRDPAKAIGIGERLTLTGKELLAGIETGKYIEEEVNELLKYPSDPIPADREDKLDNAGVSTPSPEGEMAREDARYREYQCHDFSVLCDANDDGKDELCLVTLHKDMRRILRFQYCPYEHGQHPYHMFRYGVRPNELIGWGIAEILATYQDAGSAILCQMIDHHDLQLALSSTFIVDPSAGLDPNKFVLQMGRPIFIKNPNDTVRELPMPKFPAETQMSYQLMKDRVDSVSGSSNPSLGRTTDTQRTLGEVQLVTDNQNMIFGIIAERVAWQWAPIWDQFRYLEAQYGDGGIVKYRKTAAAGTLIAGEDGNVQPAMPEFPEISAEMLLLKVDLVPAGLMQLSDVQSKTNQALLVLKTLLENPLTANIVEVIIIALENLLRAVKFSHTDEIIAAIRQNQLEQAVAMQQQQLALADLAASGAFDQAALPLKGGATQSEAGPPMPAGPGQPPPMGAM